jgi:D-sedoheptulose 7-phosphate isomerase
VKKYFAEVTECLESINSETLRSSLDLILKTSRNRSSIFIIGNGGSAAIASHFATDLLKAGYDRKVPISAYSLVDNSAIVTATSNDMQFENVFAWQLEQIAKKGDLLFAISSSGNSLNIINAVALGRNLGLKTISLAGFDGGELSNLSDIAIITRSAIGNYGPVEDAHSIICHYLSREIRNR